MALNANALAPRNLPDLPGKLAPLARVNGLQDYLLADCFGRILARKPGSPLGEEVAVEYARDAAQAGEIFALLSSPGADERVFDFRFEGVLVIVWDWGGVYLLALCSEEVNLPMMRMTANVVREELRKDKRFRGFLAPRDGADCRLLTEQALGTELHKHVVALKRK
jgi:hypothetical protein